MKYNIQNLALLSAVIAFASCESHKNSTITESGAEVVKTRTPTEDTTSKQDNPPAETRSVKGRVVAINNGKDGYTAKIETAENETYSVTISHSNLKNHAQYKAVTIGETVNVSGDFWKMGDDNQITVREIN